jgi:RHS repeat-associated protein
MCTELMDGNPTIWGVRSWADEAFWRIDEYVCGGAASAEASPYSPITYSNQNLWGQPTGMSQYWEFKRFNANGDLVATDYANQPAVRAPVCPLEFAMSDYVVAFSDKCYRPIPPVSPRNMADCGGPCDGNPINAGVGNKFQTEVDYVGSGSFPLKFSRTYNSMYAPSISSMGGYWQGSFDRAIKPWGSTGNFVAYRADGKAYVFTMSGNQGVPDTDVSDRLTKTVDGGGNLTGWTYTTADDSVEAYDAGGKLQSITSREGFRQTLTYSDSGTPMDIAPSPGLLIRVADAYGRALAFTYDSSNRVATMTEPAGGVTLYGYSVSKPELISRTDPNNGVRTYLYNETTYNGGVDRPHALTGIQDENLHRFATFAYYSTGKAYTSEHAGGAGKVTATYLSATQSKVADALGMEKTYNLTTLNGVVKAGSTTRPCASCAGGVATQTQTYDANGYPNLLTDFNGTATDSDYDNRGLLTKQVDASNDASPPTTSTKRTIDTLWNPTFRVPDQRSVKNASNTIETLTKWVYNTRGQATARCQIDPAVGGASSYTCGSSTNAPAGVRQSATAYCEQSDVTAGTCPLIGLIKSANGARLTTDAGIGGLDDTTTYTYYLTDDTSCAVRTGACPHRQGDLWKITNALGQVTEYMNYDKNGRVTHMKDANSTFTYFIYHPRGWLTDRIVRGNSLGSPSATDATLHIDYDAVGNVTKVTQPDGAYLAYTYDDAHRLLKITDNLSNALDYCSGGVGTADCLDAAGNRKVEQAKDPTNAVKRQLHRVYNQLGQLTKVLNAANATVETSLGITATGVVDGYDGNGNRVLKDDGLGFRTKQDFDPLNRLKDTIQNYAGVDPSTHDATTGYVYDSRDNLRTVTDPDGLATNYTYDGLNNLTDLDSPDTGHTHYTYDAAGNRISQTDNRVPSVTSTYTYDALNRLTGIGYPTSSLNVTYAYDQAAGCSTSFPKGRLTTMTDASGSTTYCYDRRGNVLKKTQVASGTSLVTQYTYGVADRLLTITYPSAAIVTYTRDTQGRVKTIEWKANAGATAISLITNATYYPFGPLNVLTFGNGRTLTKDYDQDYAINAISGTPAGALTLDLGVNVMGDITSASGSIAPPTADRIYQYDPLHRLTTAQTGTPSPLESYTYNKTGDRQSASLNGGAAQTYLYTTGTHRLASVAGTARTYDGNGNTQTGTAASLTLGYDDRNRLTTATQGTTSASYKISGRGERVGKTVTISGTPTTTLYSYDEAGHITGEYGSTGTMQAEYIYLDGTPVGVAKGSTLSYIESDHLGTPRQVIDRTRNVAIWKWDLLGNTFGATAPNQDPDLDSTQFVLNLRFPGQYYDAETGLIHNGWREYDKDSGRYTQSDPIGLGGGASTYAYVDGSPLTYVDLSGLAKQCYWTAQPGDYALATNDTKQYRLMGQWWIVPVCLPANPHMGVPSPKDPRRWTSWDFINYTIKCYRVRVDKLLDFRKFEIWQRGLLQCYETDDCNHITNYSEYEQSRPAGAEWRPDGSHYETYWQFIAEMNTY